MNTRTQIRRLFSNLGHSPWARSALWLAGAFIWLISLVANYYALEAAGATGLFWVLFSLSSIPLLLVGVLLIQQIRRQRQWIRDAQLYYDHQQKMETLRELAEDFTSFEKARRFADEIANKRSVRVLAILPVERRLGVLLNAGKEENLQVGTQLRIYRVEDNPSDDQSIEWQIGLVQVTYVQAQNNCSQAIVLCREDQEFWDQVESQLEQGKRVTPPRNFAMPYIPVELSRFSLEDLATLRQFLETVCNYLARVEPSRIVQEENLQ